MTPSDQVDIAYQDFRQWLLENINRPDLVGPIPPGEEASPMRRMVARIVAGAEAAYERTFEVLEAGSAADPADLARKFNNELEASKRDILAAINPSQSGGGSSGGGWWLAAAGVLLGVYVVAAWRDR